MTLISLLLVMGLERMIKKSPSLHIASFIKPYRDWLLRKTAISSAPSFIMLFIVALVPALVSWQLIVWVDNVLVVFLMQLMVLWVCLGCPVTRKTYKQYLAAAEKGDFQACSLHSMAFGNLDGDLDKVGSQLVYINYRQYAAVLIWFVLFNIPGVIFYSVLKEWQSQQDQQSSCTNLGDDLSDVLVQATDDPISDLTHDQTIEKNASERLSQKLLKQPIHTLMHILDWIPVRITALGFLVVGHFSRATSVWLSLLVDTSINTKDALDKIAVAAEDVDAGIDDCVSRPCTMVRLVKRNINFLLVLTAILTMVGSVQ